MQVTGILERLTSRDVNTRSGRVSKAWQGFVGGKKIDFGFNAPAVPEGTNIMVEGTDSPYGLKPTSVMPIAGGATATASPEFGAVRIARERAIIRQNALSNAVNFLKDTIDPMEVIATAAIFEAYSSGDMDQEQVDQAVASLFSEPQQEE